MDMPLNSWLIFENAPKHAANTEIVSQTGPQTVHRYTYADFGRRTQQLMHALDRLGLEDQDRVATLAWNGYRHLECYFAVPCTGRVLHTLNLRLSPEDLTYIIGHADDRVILADPDLFPILEKIGEGLKGVEKVVALADQVPDHTLSVDVVAYEDLIADEKETYPRRDIPENTPLGICYTSGTTGRPKGAVYTHRSNYLHTIIASSGAGLGIGPSDCTLPIVPMFHANAWGIPFAATAVGAKQVFAGAHLDPVTVVDLLSNEEVTITAGVPTIWMMVAEELAKRGTRPPALRYLICGGSQPPRALMERYINDLGIPFVQAWGMTETSPLASIAWPKHGMRAWSNDDLMDKVRTRAGLPVPGVQVTLRDEDGNDVPWDGTSLGNLFVRGPFIIDSYMKGEGGECFTQDGWFRTGDVAAGDPDGYFVIADRTKDLIKSGGEWISSVDMEGAIMAMPGVEEAAVVAIPDPKWQERPLACVVVGEGTEITVDAVRAHLEARGWAKWQLPDRIEIVEAIPKTGVGKFDKKVLRAQFG
ncbi:MAG: long-chain fatty acid--CoA ligase [Actinomycetota bacterium]